MKVVHITKLPDGGASWCAMRISRALCKQGVDSRILLMQGVANNNIAIAKADWLYQDHKNLFIRIVVKVLKLMYRPKFEYLIYKRKKAAKSANAFFTSPITGYTNLSKHPWVREADIVHLHWISDFIDFPTFFKRINKPIVWTVHDENPGLGGFHYVSHKKDASREYLCIDEEYEEIKRKVLHGKNRPHLVAISSQMKSFFENNIILKDCPITLIHNGVNCEVFHPVAKKNSREVLGLSLEKKIFLFSSYQIEDKRKGLAILLPALEALHDSSILLVCLGKYKAVPQTKYIEVKCVGMVNGSENLSLYYSASDYFMLTSFQEAFAQTPLEAMACGTPVIAFPCSGVSDLIYEKNGVICQDFTVDALIDGIRKAIDLEYSREEIRRDVKSRFSYDKIAFQYINLYHSLLG